MCTAKTPQQHQKEKWLYIMLLLLQDDHSSQLCYNKPHPGMLLVPVAEVHHHRRGVLHVETPRFLSVLWVSIYQLLAGAPMHAPVHAAPGPMHPCRDVSGVAAETELQDPGIGYIISNCFQRDCAS